MMDGAWSMEHGAWCSHTVIAISPSPHHYVIMVSAEIFPLLFHFKVTKMESTRTASVQIVCFKLTHCRNCHFECDAEFVKRGKSFRGESAPKNGKPKLLTLSDWLSNECILPAAARAKKNEGLHSYLKNIQFLYSYREFCARLLHVIKLYLLGSAHTVAHRRKSVIFV